MKNFSILFIITFLLLNNVVKGQASKETDTTSTIENAHYLNGDLSKLLPLNIKYPLNALRNNIEGDVIISLLINKHGKLDSLNILISPDIMLSTSSITPFEDLENEWSPCKINGIPINKKYLIVFRYRIYMNTEPPEYKKQAEKYFEKQKYKKALRFYNSAIKDNEYDYELFKNRSEIKELLGDIEGSKQDSLEATRIKNGIISCVDVTVVGIHRTEKRVVRTTRY